MIAIRPVSFEDLPALEWDGTYTHYRLLFRHAFADMQRGEKLLLVALVDATVVGQIFIQFRSAEAHFADGRRRAYLYSLRVKPFWQGRGIGSQLLAHAEAELKRRRFREASISVAKDNGRALALYQRLGYRIFTEDAGVWSFTDHTGQTHIYREPSWVLEKKW